MRAALRRLAEHFQELAVPGRGRYVGAPAVADRTGVVSVPPHAGDDGTRMLLGLGVAVLAGVALSRVLRGNGR